MIASPMSDAHLLAGSRKEKRLRKECIMNGEITSEMKVRSGCSRVERGDQFNASSTSTNDSTEKSNGTNKKTRFLSSVEEYRQSSPDKINIEMNLKTRSENEAVSVIERIVSSTPNSGSNFMEGMAYPKEGIDFMSQSENYFEFSAMKPVSRVLGAPTSSLQNKPSDEPLSPPDTGMQDMNEESANWKRGRLMDTDELSSCSDSSSSVCKKNGRDFEAEEDITKKSPPHLDAIVGSSSALQVQRTRGRKDEVWLSMFEYLREYKQRNGDCIVPRGYPPNIRLASWVAEQRKQYKLLKDGRSSNITPARVALLNDLGFAWSAHEAAWKGHFENLKEYREKYGNCQVSINCIEYPKLGLWVKEQRRHYVLMRQGRKSHLTRPRFEALNSLGFCWDAHENTWRERFSELQQYKLLHGNCMVPTKYPDNQTLGTWVHHQRRQLRLFQRGLESRLTPERVESLVQVGLSSDFASEKAAGSFSLENKEPQSNFQGQDSYVASEKLKASFKNDRSDDDHELKYDTKSFFSSPNISSFANREETTKFLNARDHPSLKEKSMPIEFSKGIKLPAKNEEHRCGPHEIVADHVASSSFSIPSSEKMPYEMNETCRESNDILDAYIQFKRSDSIGIVPDISEGMINADYENCSRSSTTCNDALFAPKDRPNEVAHEISASVDTTTAMITLPPFDTALTGCNRLNPANYFPVSEAPAVLRNCISHESAMTHHHNSFIPYKSRFELVNNNSSSGNVSSINSINNIENAAGRAAVPPSDFREDEYAPYPFLQDVDEHEEMMYHISKSLNDQVDPNGRNNSGGKGKTEG